MPPRRSRPRTAAGSLQLQTAVLQALSLPQLREICQTNGLSATGTRATLTKRLKDAGIALENERGEQIDRQNNPSPPTADPPAQERPQSFSNEQMATIKRLVQEAVSDAATGIASEAAKAAVNAMKAQQSPPFAPADAILPTQQHQQQQQVLGSPLPSQETRETVPGPSLGIAASSLQNGAPFQDIPSAYVKEIQTDGPFSTAGPLCRPRALSNTQSCLGNLTTDVNHYFKLSIAASTRQTYSSGEKSFLDFCALYGSNTGPAMPTDEETLIQYAAFLAQSIKHASIKNYLAAVRHLHIRNGYELNLKKCLRLQLVCRGIKRSQGSSKRTRLPITISHLKLFHCFLAIPQTGRFDSIMIWAAMTLAFFGFLRLSELTCTGTYSPAIHLSPSDITFLPTWDDPVHFSVQIKASKTDPFRTGQTILIGKSDQTICPLKAMQTYLLIRGSSPGPLFQHFSGTALTREALIAETRQLLSLSGLNSSHYAGHSYRIGAATTAASVGLPPWLIKTLGRWSSDCYERYIQCPTPLLSRVSSQLVGHMYH